LAKPYRKPQNIMAALLIPWIESHWQAILAGSLAFLTATVLVALITAARRARIEEQLTAEARRAADLEARLAQTSSALDEEERESARLRGQVVELRTRLEQETRSAREKEQLLERAEHKLGDTFKALSADALRASNEQFLQIARQALAAREEDSARDLDRRRAEIEQLVKPVAESLRQFEGRVGEMEKAREGAYAELRTQVRAMAETQTGLQRETARLVKALRQPAGRGQWGEMQLRRVVEMAGMQEHCDFDLQTGVTDADGRRLRPDLVVRMPGGKTVVVDAKTPMDAYLEALEAVDDGTREAALKRHARQVRTHIAQLASKRYAEPFDDHPEFTVLFLPAESIFSAALQTDPGLIEKGVEQGVILATPTTLVALLRAVAYGWRQEALAKNAREICDLGRTLHRRLGTLGDHFSQLGKSLDSAVGHFNAAVGSYESRVLGTARKFETLQAADPDTLESPAPVEKSTRSLAAPEETPTAEEEPAAEEDPASGETESRRKASSAASDLRSALDER
jgi:DNA recombination protein RmuC